MADGVSLSRKCREMEESRMGERSHGEALGEGCGTGEGEREGRRGTVSSSSDMTMGSTYEGIVEEEGGNGIEEWVVMEAGDILYEEVDGGG